MTFVASRAPVAPDLFNHRTVSRLTGATYRQLDYWARTGVVTPTIPAQGSGSGRRWDFAGLVAVCITARLYEAGTFFKSTTLAAMIREALAEDPSGGSWSIAGRQVWTSCDPVESVLADIGGGPVSVVWLAPVVEEMRHRVVQLEAVSA